MNKKEYTLAHLQQCRQRILQSVINIVDNDIYWMASKQIWGQTYVHMRDEIIMPINESLPLLINIERRYF